LNDKEILKSSSKIAKLKMKTMKETIKYQPNPNHKLHINNNHLNLMQLHNYIRILNRIHQLKLLRTRWKKHKKKAKWIYWAFRVLILTWTWWNWRINVNGNGYSFKNHSRFKDAYFNDLTKSKQVSSVVIIKEDK
jgi:hypothetical protein